MAKKMKQCFRVNICSECYLLIFLISIPNKKVQNTMKSSFSLIAVSQHFFFFFHHRLLVFYQSLKFRNLAKPLLIYFCRLRLFYKNPIFFVSLFGSCIPFLMLLLLTPFAFLTFEREDRYFLQCYWNFKFIFFFLFFFFVSIFIFRNVRNGEIANSHFL